MTTNSTSGETAFSGTLAYDPARDELNITIDGRELAVPGAAVRHAMQCEMRIERMSPGATTEAAIVRLRRGNATHQG